MFGLEQKHIELIKTILKKYLSKDQKVYVFGSRSTGNYKKYSDLDLAIEGNIDIIKLSNEFKDSSLPIDIDIVLIEDLSSEFLKKIKKDFIEFGIFL